MAYLRLTEQCSVYFFARSEGGWECCGCLLQLEPGAVSKGFGDLDTAVHHLYDHVLEGHVNLTEADRVSRELRGRQERRPDAVIQEMVDLARLQGSEGMIASDDADVPEDLRVTTMQLLEQLKASAEDPETLASVEEAITMIEKLKTEAQ